MQSSLLRALSTNIRDGWNTYKPNCKNYGSGSSIVLALGGKLGYVSSITYFPYLLQ
jgi:hypothetical protein